MLRGDEVRRLRGGNRPCHVFTSRCRFLGRLREAWLYRGMTEKEVECDESEKERWRRMSESEGVVLRRLSESEREFVS